MRKRKTMRITDNSVAVLLPGYLRPTWKRFYHVEIKRSLLRPNQNSSDIDVFVHTWDNIGTQTKIPENTNHMI